MHLGSFRTSGSRRGRSGFTMIELLVVMAILSLLGGLAALGIPAMMRAGQRKSMTLKLAELSGAIEAYSAARENGDYPPTLLDKDDFPGVGHVTNNENCGIESVMLCLNRIGRPSGFNPEDSKEVELRNEDEDRTQVVLTSFGPENRELYELVDIWGTPLAYFHSRDYAQVESKDLGRVTGGLKCVPYKDPKTKDWFKRTKFQLISAGEDRTFNTEDDLANFEIP